jgi:hypothetical protein
MSLRSNLAMIGFITKHETVTKETATVLARTTAYGGGFELEQD